MLHKVLTEVECEEELDLIWKLSTNFGGVYPVEHELGVFNYFTIQKASRAVSKLVDLHYGDLIYLTYKGAEYLRLLDDKLLERNPHRQNMISGEFINAEIDRVDKLVDEYRQSLKHLPWRERFVDSYRWTLEYKFPFIFNKGIRYVDGFRVFENKYLNEFPIKYYEGLGYSLEDLRIYYEEEEEKENKKGIFKDASRLAGIVHTIGRVSGLLCDYYRVPKEEHKNYRECFWHHLFYLTGS